MRGIARDLGVAWVTSLQKTSLDGETSEPSAQGTPHNLLHHDLGKATFTLYRCLCVDTPISFQRDWRYFWTKTDTTNYENRESEPGKNPNAAGHKPAKHWEEQRGYYSALSLDVSCPAAKAKRETRCLRSENTQGLLSPQGLLPFLSCADLLTLRTVLAVFGKGCLSSSFSCLFLYTSELYPTVIR